MRLFFVVFCAAWAGGIAAGASAAPAGVLFGITLLAGVLGWRLRLSAPAAAASGSLVLLGFMYAAGGQAAMACSPADAWEGVVAERPRVKEGWQQAVVDDGRGCRVLLTADRWLPLSAGSRVLLSGGDLETLAEVADFSEGYAEYLERQGITLTWRWAQVRVLDARRHRINSVYSAAQQRVSSVFGEPDAGLVRALLLADRSGLPDDLAEQFRVTGVSHILSISGLHVSFLAGLFYGLALLLPLPPWPRLFLMLALLWGYLFFIGAPISAVRAGLFWTFAGLALRSGQLVSLPAVFVTAAVVMLTVRPRLVLEVGWQLSFAAVAGIFLSLFVLRPALRVWRERSAPLFFVSSLLLVSAGATIMTWPLTLYHFGSVSLVGLPANAVIVPASTLTLAAAAAALLLSAAAPPLGLAAGFAVHLLVTVMDSLTRWLSRMPYASLDDVILPMWALGLYYAAVLAGCAVWLRRQGQTWREMWV